MPGTSARYIIKQLCHNISYNSYVITSTSYAIKLYVAIVFTFFVEPIKFVLQYENKILKAFYYESFTKK